MRSGCSAKPSYRNYLGPPYPSSFLLPTPQSMAVYPDRLFATCWPSKRLLQSCALAADLLLPIAIGAAALHCCPPPWCALSEPRALRCPWGHPASGCKTNAIAAPEEPLQCSSGQMVTQGGRMAQSTSSGAPSWCWMIGSRSH